MLMLMSHVAESRTTHRSEPRRGSDLYKKTHTSFRENKSRPNRLSSSPHPKPIGRSSAKPKLVMGKPKSGRGSAERNRHVKSARKHIAPESTISRA